MSQPSETYPFPLIGSDAIDDLSYLQSESIAPEHSASQITPETSSLPPIPSTLKRSEDRAMTWVIYEEMNKQDFLDWWFSTQIGQDEGVQKKFKSSWDGKSHHADIWSQFEQVAHSTTGKPKVRCKRCLKVLDHPNYTGNGTNSLRRHTLRGLCQKQARQSNIQHLVQNQVTKANKVD